MTKLSGFFRSMPVQWPKQDTDRNIFRSMPVHFLRKVGPAASFPEQPRSVSPLGNRVPATFFRSMPVHSSRSFSYFCARINKSSTGMAGTIKDMSLIKRKHPKKYTLQTLGFDCSFAPAITIIPQL